MKILIISYSFPPDNSPASQRPYFMAKYLAKLGHDVTVLTSGNSLSSLGKSNWGENLTGVNVLKTSESNGSDDSSVAVSAVYNKKWKERLKGIYPYFLVPDKGILWLKELIKFNWNKINNPDVIYSTAPLYINHLVAMRVARKYGCKWVADIRDFYYHNHIEEKKLGIRKLLDKKIESSIFKRADYVTFISDSMRESYMERYPDLKEKSTTIYNGFESGEYNFNNVGLPTDKIKIFYAGSFYDGLRSPEPLLASLDLLLKDKSITEGKLEINVAGNMPEELKKTLQKYRSHRILNYLGFIPRNEAIRMMNESHLLWLIVANLKSHYMGFPLKGYEYIGSRRQILLFSPPNCEPQRILDDLRCGAQFNTDLTEGNIKNNSKKLNSIFQKILASPTLEPVQIEHIKLKKYTREEQAHALEKLITEL